VDAIVVATALRERAVVIATSDPTDFDLLLGDPAIRVKPRLLVV
jgi:hypothetical protein